MNILKIAVSLSVSSISAISLIALLNIACPAQDSQPQRAGAEVEGTLTINVHGFTSTAVDIDLFKSSSPKTNPFRQQSATIENGNAMVAFAQIPMGDYVIKVRQKNRTGKESKNRRVRLTAVSYSKNEERIFAPIWKKSQFHMNKAEMTVEIAAVK